MALDKARSTILIVLLVCTFLANQNMGHLTIGRRVELDTKQQVPPKLKIPRRLVDSHLRTTENTHNQNSDWKTKMEEVRELIEKKYQ